MAQWFDLKTEREEASFRRLIAAHMKRCPLCDCLNLVEAPECVSCGWLGQFERRPELIEEAFERLLELCPEVTDVLQFEVPKPPSFWVRAATWIRRRFRRPLDLRA
jgi:hypothetical protein